jgi:hypothetical protein
MALLLSQIKTQLGLEEATKSKHPYHVWDNGGKTADRYTVVHHEDAKNPDRHGHVDMLGLSHDPHSAGGFSQHTTGQMGKHLGKKIPFHKLEKHIQDHIHSRYKEAGYHTEEVDLGESRVWRNPFAREEVHATREYAAGVGHKHTCDNCGSEKTTKSGKKYQYKFHTETDGGRKMEHTGKFCSKGCHDSYHGIDEEDDSYLDDIYDGIVLNEEEHDEHGKHELILHADNDSHLYHSSHVPIAKNLEKKHRKGIYDKEKAKKLWKYHADRAAQSYHKVHGDAHSAWHKAFSPATRRAAAEHWEHHHRMEMEAGNFHDH